MMSVIKITCVGASSIRVDKLKPLSDSSLIPTESNYQRLRMTIEEYGFVFPITVWRNKKDYWIIDGHQRVATIKRMLEEGYTLHGKKLPVLFVNAKDKKEAYKIGILSKI